MNHSTHWITTAGFLGALAVAVGAFGSHGLPSQLERMGSEPDQIARRLQTFETGVRYHMYSALAILALGVAHRPSPRRLWDIACGLLLAGTILFSGLLYVLALVGNDYRWLGAVVPIGGVMMIAGWAMIAVGAMRPREAMDQK